MAITETKLPRTTQLQAAMEHRLDGQELDLAAELYDGYVHGEGHGNRRPADYGRDEYEERNYEYERADQTRQLHVASTGNPPPLAAEGPYGAQPERVRAIRGGDYPQCHYYRGDDGRFGASGSPGTGINPSDYAARAEHAHGGQFEQRTYWRDRQYERTIAIPDTVKSATLRCRQNNSPINRR
jgi:hypothetical protein